jgi:hypothetical protein
MTTTASKRPLSFTHNILFGDTITANKSQLNNARNNKIDSSKGMGILNRSTEYDWETEEDARSVQDVQPASTGIVSFFFGFMWEEPLDDDEILKSKNDSIPIWNPLNTFLFVAYCLTLAATSFRPWPSHCFLWKKQRANKAAIRNNWWLLCPQNYGISCIRNSI